MTRRAFPIAQSVADHGEVQRLLGYMPIIVRAAGITDWERQFCISITGRIKRGPITPSSAQIATMQRIVAAFQRATDDDAPLIEGGAGNEG